MSVAAEPPNGDAMRARVLLAGPRRTLLPHICQLLGYDFARVINAKEHENQPLLYIEPFSSLAHQPAFLELIATRHTILDA
jgi:hypothetical protein